MKIRLVLIFIYFNSQYGFAQLTLPKMFSNNMVLQRNVLIPVWGNATPGATIEVTLGIKSVSARTDSSGKWVLYIPKHKEGGPYTLKVTEHGNTVNTREFSNVLIGDVWLASGQSNMEMQVQQSMDAKKEISNATYPEIRFLQVQQSIQLTPQTDIKTEGWKVIDTNTVKNISAVAYYFARNIRKEHNVPVGIIQSTWGGTPIEAWTSREMLLSSTVTREKTLSNDTLKFEGDVSKIDSSNWRQIWNIVLDPHQNTDKYMTSDHYSDSDWPNVELPGMLEGFGIGFYEGIVWLRKRITVPGSFDLNKVRISLGHPEINYSLYINGREICRNIWNVNSTHSYNIPANTIHPGENIIAVRIAMMWGGGGINKPAEDLYITDEHTRLSLAGTWKFKNNLETAFPKLRNYQYYPALLFNGMINPLIPFGIKGFIWYQGESNVVAAYDYQKLFPNLIADWRQRWQQDQLTFLFVQLANYKGQQSAPTESQWADLREAQTMTLAVPHTGMACTIDIGEANDIHPKNKQEVGRRLALIAGKKAYQLKTVAESPIFKRYQIKRSGIRIVFRNKGSYLKIKEGDRVKGFAIAGADRKYFWADAEIKGNAVIVHSKDVLKPLTVRYAWADNPECNLVNSAGLPVVPFRTDNWREKKQK